MPSANFDRIVLLSRNKMQTAFLLILLLVVDALQNDVGLVRLWNGHHLNIFGTVTNDLGEGTFADLALEFSEVVALGDPLDLFLHLAVYPSPKAAHMDHLAAAFAIAGRNQRIRFRFLTAQTNLTTSLPLINSLVMLSLMLLDFKHAVSFFKMVGIPEGVGVSLVFGLYDHILNSP